MRQLLIVGRQLVIVAAIEKGRTHNHPQKWPRRLGCDRESAHAQYAAIVVDADLPAQRLWRTSVPLEENGDDSPRGLNTTIEPRCPASQSALQVIARATTGRHKDSGSCAFKRLASNEVNLFRVSSS